jgi:hypothetical protein
LKVSETVLIVVERRLLLVFVIKSRWCGKPTPETVTLSPPNKLSPVRGVAELIEHPTVWAETALPLGILPSLETISGTWSPQVGTASRVQVMAVAETLAVVSNRHLVLAK